MSSLLQTLLDSPAPRQETSVLPMSSVVQKRLKTLFLRLDRWMSRHKLELDYLETYPGLDRAQQHRVHYYWRLIELELDVDHSPAWREEQKLILEAPSDWLTRYGVGDAVDLPDIPEAEGRRFGQRESAG